MLHIKKILKKIIIRKKYKKIYIENLLYFWKQKLYLSLLSLNVISYTSYIYHFLYIYKYIYLSFIKETLNIWNKSIFKFNFIVTRL